MDTWLKMLVAAACVVVIAGGGYYGWGEYQQYGERRAPEIEREKARERILGAAGGAPGSPEADAFCERIRKSVAERIKGNGNALLFHYDCKLFGYP